ncbi:MAG: helix-turn-helix domain containing protein [bacterium]|nr:helix-turn-helix domain containing protein [bacterium]
MPRRKKSDPKIEVLREHGTLNPGPDQVVDPAFLEGEFFDPRDLLQVKYEMLRRVRCDGHSVVQATRQFGFSRPSFYKARSDFEQFGLAGLLPAKRGPRGPHKLTEPVMAFVAEQLSEDETLSAEVLAERIERRFGRRVHPRTIERALARKKKR